VSPLAAVGGVTASLNRGATAKKPDDENDQGNQEENVDQAAPDVNGKEADRPQYHQNYNYRFKHFFLPKTRFEIRLSDTGWGRRCS
jgi:hypothetical protein